MANLAHKLESLYVRCMNCLNTASLCPGAWKDIPAGVPPRGFFCQVAPVKLLIVAKNPGHPLLREREHYQGRSEYELYRAYQRFQENLHSTADQFREPSMRFLKTLFRYISFFLDIPNNDIYLHAAHTNLVKCSTPDERGRLDRKTMGQCYPQYLRAEIDLLRPKVLVALGREVERFLRRNRLDHGLPVIYIKHPSHRYPKEDEQQILTGIKRQILTHL